MFDAPVSEHMAVPLHSVMDTETLAHAEQRMSEWGVSALPVVSADGRLVGVLSRTDLLRVGRVRMQNGRRRKVITLPDARVREVMRTTVEVVAPDTSLAEAARRMLRRHIHRLYVVSDGRPLGVVGMKELMRVLLDANVRMPIVELMHGSLVVVQAGDPLSVAVDRMIAAQHVGLVVVEDGWPVGFFTQADALAARDAPADHRVDEWMDPHVICLPERIPVHRAVEQALALRARCVLAVDAEGIRGILTGMDVARLVAGGV